MAFSFRQIQYFVAVAERGAVSRAAQQLSISQSTVTEAIQELEADLGFVLFERHAQGVELTLKGHHFLRHAHKILSDVADARRALRDDIAPLAGRLALGVTPLVSSYVLSDLLARFQRAHPAVTVDVVEDGRDYLEHLLVGGELDVAIVVLSGGAVTQGLHVEVVDVSRSRLWLPLGHKLTNAETVSLRDIAGEKHVLLGTDEIAETVEASWRRLAIRPPIALRTRSVEAVRSLVATGAGVAILPDLTYRPWSLEGDKIEARQIVEELPPVEVALLWRRGSMVPPFVERIARLAALSRTARR
jgi:DNA-binding transcriptional LysR family regulator